MSHYGTLVGAADYHDAVGNTAWAASAYTDPQRTAALTRASRALDGRYGMQFAGVKSTSDQRLAWPRNGGHDFCSDTPVPPGQVPLGVIEAAYELALIELQGPGALSPSLTTGRITKSEAVVGAASRSFFSPEELGLNGGLDAFRPTLTVAEDLLGCYLNRGRRWIATVV